MPHLECKNLNKIVEDTTQILRIQAESLGVTIVVEKLREFDCVMVDQARVQQILINLIHNSIKFSNTLSQVYV